MRKKCGLLGKTLGHSYSPLIHSKLGDYDYSLFEVSEDKLEDFIKNGDWDGLNVTIPYKKDVFPFLDETSEVARKMKSVNTIIRRADGTLYGDNTDVYGFEAMIINSGVDIRGRKTLVLGSGGASVAIIEALSKFDIEPIVISRSGENNYDNIDRHYDTEVIVNTTPVGMYPNTGKSPVDLVPFKNLKVVYDIVYNPARTELTMQAEELGIKAYTGLYMLVAQAKRGSEEFTDSSLDVSVIEKISTKLGRDMQNIVLIGMPGCGKSTIGKLLAHELNRELLDADEIFTERYKISPSECIKSKGESTFRDMESQVIEDIGKLSGKIISTGGGVVLRKENYKYLHCNGQIVYIKRDIDKLPTHGRPLSQSGSLKDMFEKRREYYELFCDYEVENNSSVEKVAEEIVKLLF